MLRVEVTFFRLTDRVINMPTSTPSVFSKMVTSASSPSAGLGVLVCKLLVVKLIWGAKLRVVNLVAMSVHRWWILIVRHFGHRVKVLWINLNIVTISPSASFLSPRNPSASVMWLTLIKALRHDHSPVLRTTAYMIQMLGCRKMACVNTGLGPAISITLASLHILLAFAIPPIIMTRHYVCSYNL